VENIRLSFINFKLFQIAKIVKYIWKLPPPKHPPNQSTRCFRSLRQHRSWGSLQPINWAEMGGSVHVAWKHRFWGRNSGPLLQMWFEVSQIWSATLATESGGLPSFLSPWCKLCFSGAFCLSSSAVSYLPAMVCFPSKTNLGSKTLVSVYSASSCSETPEKSARCWFWPTLINSTLVNDL